MQDKTSKAQKQALNDILFERFHFFEVFFQKNIFIQKSKWNYFLSISKRLT